MELIKSTSVALRVVDKLSLDKAGKFILDRQPTLMESLIQGARSLLSRTPVRKQIEGHDVLLASDKQRLAAKLKEGITVARKEWTYVIEVRYTDEDPVFAAQIANAFAAEYLVDQLEAKYEATSRANSWLFARLEELRTKVRASERSIENFKTKHGIVAAKGTDLNEQQIAKLSEQLILIRAETAQKRAKYQSLLAVIKKGGETTSFADRLQSQLIGTLRTKATELRRVLADLRARYGSRHPKVQSTRAQLTDVVSQIKTEAKRILATATNDYQIALSRERSIEKSLNLAKGEKTGNNQGEHHLARIGARGRCRPPAFRRVFDPL